MGFQDEVVLELIKTVLSGVIVAFGWLVGERIVAYWDGRKKQQELDISVAREFHRLYGEFKDVSRQWRTFKYDGPEPNITLPAETPVDLLRRTSAAEGGIEAIIVKLASERELSSDEVRTLGLFRQAYQQLREAIRANRQFLWTYGSTEYHLYNELAGKVSRVIAATRIVRQSRTADAIDTLDRITAVRPTEWDSEVKAVKLRRGAHA